MPTCKLTTGDRLELLDAPYDPNDTRALHPLAYGFYEHLPMDDPRNATAWRNFEVALGEHLEYLAEMEVKREVVHFTHSSGLADHGLIVTGVDWFGMHVELVDGGWSVRVPATCIQTQELPQKVYDLDMRLNGWDLNADEYVESGARSVTLSDKVSLDTIEWGAEIASGDVDEYIITGSSDGFLPVQVGHKIEIPAPSADEFWELCGISVPDHDLRELSPEEKAFAEKQANKLPENLPPMPTNEALVREITMPQQLGLAQFLKTDKL